MVQISRPTESTPETPPEDFGQALIDEFERRTTQSDEGAGGASPVDDPGRGDFDGTPGVPTLALENGGAGDSAQDEGGERGPEDRLVPAPSPDEPVVQDELVAQDEPAVPATETAEPATDPAVGSAPDPAEPASDPTPDPGPTPGYIWSEGDQTAAFSDQQVREALNLSAWASALPDEIRQQFIQVESGQAVAIPRADYAQYVAWRDNRASDTDLDGTDGFYPGSEAREIAALKAEIEALKAGYANTGYNTPAPGAASPGQPGVPFVPVPHMGTASPPVAQAAFNQSADATVAAMDEATAAYATAHGLTPEQVDGLLNEAVAMNVIPSIADSLASYNPVTGGLLAPGDPRQIITQALDVALVRNPELFNRANTPTQVSPSTPQSEPLPAPSTAEGDAELARKKARAGSVSSAPASTTPPSTKAVESMSRSEITDAMTRELAAAMGSGQ